MAKTGSRPTDELIRLAMIGDGTAFTELWDTHIDTLRAYLKSTMKNLDDFFVEDICSRSFEKAFRQIATYDPAKSKFATWLRTIAHNTALDVIDGENRISRPYVYLDDTTRQVAAVEEMTDQLDSPLDTIIRSEEQLTTAKCIEGLPDLYRTVATLRLIEGYPYKDIAEATGLELNTVRTRIRRAKAQIEKMKETPEI